MKRYIYWGGPLDGAAVPEHMVKEPFSVVDKRRPDGTIIIYAYVKCEDHPLFEYVGEWIEEDGSE